MADDITPRELIVALRGEPTKCDFCDATPPMEQLHPEEGGLWVCEACIARWEESDHVR